MRTVCYVGVLGVLLLIHQSALAREVQTEANVPVEIAFSAARTHDDPFRGVTLDVVVTGPDGATRKVPAFWAGGSLWKVRYASPGTGLHRWKSVCNDIQDSGLHGLEGVIRVDPYRGDNPLFRHGPIRVAADRRHFEHADGSPFFWLGDTWWMGLCHRLHYPEEFQRLAADRKHKGFTVVQIVAGLYPDMDPFDPRGANEAGFPWDPGFPREAGRNGGANETGFPWEARYTRIRPAYFDAADARLRHLVDQGITPCIVGAWGYFMPWMGVEKLEAHWRYLIARYGSWPVVWCAAGEANLPWYLAKGFPYDDREQVKGWTEVMRSIRATDPFHRPLTVHPTAINFYTARHATDDAALLDFDMLQTPHGQREAVPITVKAVRDSYDAKPVMPVLDGEASYEMLMDSLPTEWTRAMFWIGMTGGAAGHTYGANGIWQVNRRGQPHGKSPHGGTYGKIPWDEAMNLPGSTQMGIGKRFFESLPWTRMVPMPSSVAWAGSEADVPLGDWIWFPEGDPKRDAPVAARYFRRTFELADPAAARRATLRVTADDSFTAWLNGQQVATGAGHPSPAQVDVTRLLKRGRNVLAIRAENRKAPVTLNPAGLAATLAVEGVSTVVRSDATWRASRVEADGWRGAAFDDAGWPAALVTARQGEPPWGKIGGGDPLFAPLACGIGDDLKVVYVLTARPVLVRGLKPAGPYLATYLDPVTGDRAPAPTLAVDSSGQAIVQPPAHGHDWVVLLEQSPGLR